MNDLLRLSLLGKLKISLEQQEITIRATKARALLAYLAVTGQAHPRLELSALLWGGKPEKDALANLRMAFTQLRKVVPDHLNISRTMATFNYDAPHWLDVADFTAACETLKNNLTTANFDELRDAISYYRGDFLDDLYVPDAPEFEGWLLLERERLRQMALDGWQILTAFAFENRRYAEGVTDARQILNLDPWREETHCQLMRLLAIQGQRGAALAQFEACRKALVQEFGVEPAATTVDLYQKIKEGEVGGPEKTKIAVSELEETLLPPNNLPANTTPFIGRETELSQISKLVADPDCRLLTLVGPGGMGKTRLALEAARRALNNQVETFADGIFFVPLAALESAEDMIPAIGQAIGLDFSGSQALDKQLIHQIQSKKMLLILDNYEQLIESGEWLVKIIKDAPGLTFMTTSRERLNLYEEWIFDVTGLPVPGINDVEVDSYGAIQLFQQRARRVHLGFDVASQKASVIEICQLAEGMPLAIELAAAWVRAMSCSSIVKALRDNLDILTTGIRNVPERQRSIRSAFLTSWQRLSNQSQLTLARLSLFRGGFSRKAARTVVGASRQTLTLLVDHSLLQVETSDRFQIHELLRQFAAEKLAEYPAHVIDAAQQAYINFFATFMAGYAESLRGSEPEEAAERIGRENDNIRSAWQWMIKRKDTNAIDHSLNALFELYDLRAWYIEGERFLASASEVHSDRDLLSARIDAFRGRFLYRLGQFQKSEQLIRRSLPILGEKGELREFGDALNGLSNVRRRLGNYDESRQMLEQAKQVYREGGFRRGVASVLNNQGLAAYRQGDYETATSLQQQSVAIYRDTGPIKDLATVLNNLGLTRLMMGELEEAQNYLNESTSAAKRINYQALEVVATQNLGLVAVRQMDYESAESCLLESLALSRELNVEDMTGDILGDLCILYLKMGYLTKARQYGKEALLIGRKLGVRWLEAAAQVHLANVALAEDKLQEAIKRLRSGLLVAVDIEAQSLIISGLIGWANLLIKKGEFTQAVEILTMVQSNPSEDPDHQQSVTSLLVFLRGRMSSTKYQKIQEAQTILTPVEMAKRILAQLRYSQG